MPHYVPPPWLPHPDKFEDEHGATRLSRSAARGEIVRVRRGFYLPTLLWESLKPWQRYRTVIQAVHDSARIAPVFARESAASILGLPILVTPQEIHCLNRIASSGGRNEYGVWRHNPLPGDPQPWRVDGLLTTPLVETARDLAAAGTFAQGLTVMDRLLLPKLFPGIPLELLGAIRDGEVQDSLARLDSNSQRRRVVRALNFANVRSESPGESWSRAIMIQNGFPAPNLQVPFYDDRGLIGYPDFDWEEFKLLGEFDGFEKYSSQRYLKGKTPSEAVVAEKNRENRLRALGYNVVRWVWDDLRDERRLMALLHAAGLPSAGR